MIDAVEVFLAKAEESLTGAESEFANQRYNNSANRAYYACLQAAICALIRAGVQPRGSDGRWEHRFVQSHFAGELINRRKLYPLDLRGALLETFALRRRGDYEDRAVTGREASRVRSVAQVFVEAVQPGTGGMI